MRELYRAAEARAARMRLLSDVGKRLSEATQDTIGEILEQCAERLAFFVGSRSAIVTLGAQGDGIPICAPGVEGPVGRITVEGLASETDIPDEEDRETLRIYLEWMGATIDRANRETERGRLLDALRDREKRLEDIVGRIFTAQEDERRRVSQELHDGVAQTATALARMIEGPGGADSPDMPAAERKRLAEIARELVTELRGVISGLRPTLLDDLGVEAAIGSLAQGLEKDGFTVSFDSSCVDAHMEPNVENALFRVAQEAISNIRKHCGGPCSVFIDLRLDGANADNGMKRFLRIRDTGVGLVNPVLSGEDSGNHIGIDVMKERMTAIGGRLDWSSGPKGGVTVTAFVPEGVSV
ncbi:histidine kinase [Erythrobacter sp.]|uniref:sensor histidine kinase n=1 Tax=Erythrobacter sp. TaxID=1042 RepID=UPI000AF70B7B|nr:histidine kinase [Erythrobacter sp.]